MFCALFGRLCANAPTIGDAIALLGARKARTRPAEGRAARAASARTSPGSRTSRASTSSATPTAARCTSASRSTCARGRARTSRTGATWAADAEHVDHQVTESELGALLLEDRLIKALRPPGNVRGKAEPDGYVYLRCRLDIPFPILEVAREPAAGHAVCVGPVRGRAAAAELVEQLNSLFGLRHCGRTLPRREHPSAYGQMGRCLSPCLHDLDPNLYRERLDAALQLFVGRDGGEALLARVDEQIARGLGGRSATSARPGCSAGAGGSRRCSARLGGVLRATHTGARLVLAPHPEAAGRFDAIWIAGGRVVDWGPGEAAAELAPRSARALRRGARGRAASAAGCPRTPWRRRGWSAPGSPPTSPLPWSSGPGRGRRHTPPSSPGPGSPTAVVVDSVNVSVFA